MDTEAQACAYDRGATSSSFRGGGNLHEIVFGA